MQSNEEQSKGPGDVFWGEIAPSEHLVQIYESPSVLLNSLESFARTGLEAGEGVIVIASAGNLRALEQRLCRSFPDVDLAAAEGRYIALPADEALSHFLVNGWPDEEKFRALIDRLLAQARGNDRRVRAFGEMVAVLWGRGLNAATVRLEHLWHRLCESESFPLYCAYPRIGFTTNDVGAAAKEICDLHSRVLLN